MLDIFQRTYILTTTNRYPKFKDGLEKNLSDFGVKNLTIFEVGKDWIDEDVPDGWTGRKQSWNYWNCIWKIVEQAKTMKLKNFLFVEDDADFRPEFKEIFPKAIQELPLYWDMFYLGGNHHFSTTYRISEYILKCTCTLDMHCVAISENVYDKILDFKNKDWLKNNPYADGTIVYQIHPLGYSYCCCPSLVWQYDGWSDNEQKYMSRTQNWQHNGQMIDLRGV